MSYTATSKILRRDGKKVASISGWWDSQMMYEGLIFTSLAEENVWETYYQANKTFLMRGQTLTLTKGDNAL